MLAGELALYTAFTGLAIAAAGGFGKTVNLGAGLADKK